MFRPLAAAPQRHVRCSAGAASEARDVRAVPIKLITVSKGNSPGASAMAAEWLEKLRRWAGSTPMPQQQEDSVPWPDTRSAHVLQVHTC